MALMDTMTNVVGVLTIVMVMIGISLARAASRVFSALPPATAAQVQALAAGFQGYKAVGVDTGSHSTVALAPQAVAAVAVVP